MKKLNFTQEQITKILSEVANRENGFEEVLKLSLEALMRAEREEYKNETRDMSNGYRPRKSVGRGKMLELQVPRTRHGNFYPLILGLLRNQEEEARQIAFKLYGAGLTTSQVGELFGDIYGKRYSTSQVSRIFDFARDEVSHWLQRPLEPYYPILMIDATFIYTRRVDSVSKEGYYTILGVKEDRTREVLSIVNFPTESASAWEAVFEDLKKRGLEQTNLVICDSLKSIEDAIWRQFPFSEVQLCTVHARRNVLKRVKPKHKSEVASDLNEVFRVGDSSYTQDQGMQSWRSFCEKWGKYYPSIKQLWEEPRYDLYFTYLGYDYRVQSMLYSTNWVERLNRDYKRTTKMRGALPNAEATILLLGYVAMTRNAYQRKVPKLNYERNKFKWAE